MSQESLRLSDFDYHLPKNLIAQYPCPKREDSRLLVLERDSEKITHRNFKGFVDYLSAGDCLVLNDTRVIWARMKGRRQTRLHLGGVSGGGKQELFLLESLAGNTYRVLARPARKLTVGAKVLFDNGNICAEVLSDLGMTKLVKFSGNGKVQNLWQEFGRVPLPPYIKREPEDLDKERYQTVYASEVGATAAPTAGLHFTREILDIIRSNGINVVNLTLHVNYGTFAPVKSENISEHKMHKEYFILSRKTAQIINQTRARGKKVFAVGTTSARVLETCAGRQKCARLALREEKGWTELFIYPPYRFKAVDCLLTNFHFPKSTLLMLVSAFAGKDLIFKAYQEAIEKKYRFFSYGDAMLVI